MRVRVIAEVVEGSREDVGGGQGVGVVVTKRPLSASKSVLEDRSRDRVTA